MPLRIDRLQEIREKQGISQRTLAKLCHLNYNQIYRYESGNSEPSISNLAVIADKLGVSADYLLGLTDEPHGLAPGADVNPLEREILNIFRRDGWRGLLQLVTYHLTK